MEMLERVLKPSDVLLEGSFSKRKPASELLLQLRRHFQQTKGQTHYQEQLRFYHPIYRMVAANHNSYHQYHHGGGFTPSIPSSSTEEQVKSLVWSVLESVWAKDGRFLLFDESTYTLSIADNDTAYKLVMHGLQQTPPNSSSTVPERSKFKQKKRSHKKKNKNKTVVASKTSSHIKTKRRPDKARGPGGLVALPANSGMTRRTFSSSSTTTAAAATASAGTVQGVVDNLSKISFQKNHQGRKNNPKKNNPINHNHKKKYMKPQKD